MYVDGGKNGVEGGGESIGKGIGSKDGGLLLQKGWENILCIEKTKAIQVDITKSRINI